MARPGWRASLPLDSVLTHECAITVKSLAYGTTTCSREPTTFRTAKLGRAANKFVVWPVPLADRNRADAENYWTVNQPSHQYSTWLDRAA